MEALLSQFTLETKEEVKRYLAEKEIPQLFEVSVAPLSHSLPLPLADPLCDVRELAVSNYR